MRCLLFLSISVLVGTLTGCGGGPTVYPVKGRVHFADGTPLESGRISIDVGSKRSGSSGLIYPDGSFTMGTFTDKDGVPAGSYRVFIQNTMTQPPPNHTGRFVSVNMIHPKFNDPEKSDLKFEVPKQLEWDIVVEKPK